MLKSTIRNANKERKDLNVRQKVPALKRILIPNGGKEHKPRAGATQGWVVRKAGATVEEKRGSSK